MVRDYKSRSGRRRKKKDRSPMRFLAGGFALGLVAAAGVYFALAPEPASEPDRPVPAVQRSPVSVDDEPEAAEPTPAPPAARARRREDRFDFYEYLPNFEVVIPESDESVEDTPPSHRVDKPGAYVLQAGSFRSYKDADTMKARLALQGIEAQIQKVTIGDDQTWHRVRIGPLTELTRVNRLRTQLREQDIDALLLRVAE